MSTRHMQNNVNTDSQVLVPSIHQKFIDHGIALSGANKCVSSVDSRGNV